MRLKLIKDANKKGTKLLSYVLIILSVMSALAFFCFIIEEAFQTIMFSTWQSIDIGQWEAVAQACDLMEQDCKIMKWTLYTIGWINPLAFISYRQYAKAGDHYVKALRSKIAFHAPEMLAGKRICLTVQVRRIEPLENSGYRIRTNNLNILVDSIPNQQRIQVDGVVQVRDGQAVVDLRERK